MEETRYYYKSKTGAGYYNLKHQLTAEEMAESNCEAITKEQFDELTYVPPYQPTEEEIAAQEKANAIASKKAELLATDYVVIKIAESEDPEEIAALREEYAAVIAHRKQLRVEINELEKA